MLRVIKVLKNEMVLVNLDTKDKSALLSEKSLAVILLQDFFSLS